MDAKWNNIVDNTMVRIGMVVVGFSAWLRLVTVCWPRKGGVVIYQLRPSCFSSWRGEAAGFRLGLLPHF